MLRLINALNARTIFDAAGRLPDPPVAPNTPPPFYDVNGDGYLTPALDVLPVINYLNGVTSGEGEAAASSTIVADTGSQARAAISSDPAATVTVLSPTWPVSGESGTSELTETSDAMDERPRTRDVPSTDPAPSCWHFDQAVTEVTDDPSLDPLPDGLAEDLADGLVSISSRKRYSAFVTLRLRSDVFGVWHCLESEVAANRKTIHDSKQCCFGQLPSISALALLDGGRSLPDGGLCQPRPAVAHNRCISKCAMARTV